MTRAVRSHHHFVGRVLADEAGRITGVDPRPGSIEHEHEMDLERPHTHQACICDPHHQPGRCPDPRSSLAGEPPLLFSQEALPEPPQLQEGFATVRTFREPR